MSGPSQVAIIDPAVRVAELDCFNHLVHLSPIPLTYHLPAMFGLDSLGRAPETLAGIVVLGSSSSVYEGKPWQKGLEEWLLPHLERGVPILGLCYGHQLIAHLLGARVGFHHPDKRKLSGWRRVTLEPSALTAGQAREGQLFMSHREVVEECPASMRISGKSPLVPIEALEHKSRPVWTFQAHPEATPGFLTNQGIPATDNVGLFAFGHELVRSFLQYAAAGR